MWIQSQAFAGGIETFSNCCDPGNPDGEQNGLAVKLETVGILELFEIKMLLQPSDRGQWIVTLYCCFWSLKEWVG